MLDGSPGELATTCRDQASRTTNEQARSCQLKMADEYDEQASIARSFVNDLFYEEPIGTFQEGYVFRAEADLAGARKDPDNGYWACDIADGNKLTWSRKVYELFGLPSGAAVERDWAVARYSEQSRDTLERVRNYALRRDFGFILDAEIEQPGERARWIRVLAVPVTEDRRVVRLHGVKRPL